jgi:uncharacterized protein YndB with AHSA1/START domain
MANLKGVTMNEYAEELNTNTIRFERLLPGPIERVWDYLYDEKKRSEWFASGIMPANPGETFEMRFKHSEYSPNQSTPPDRMREVDENGHSSTNILLKCEPPHLLAFTFGPQTRSSEPSEVEFRLDQEGDKVRLTLTHRKIPDRNFKLSVSGGWHSHLDILRYKLESKTAPGFWDVWRKYDGIYEARYD